MIGGKAPSGAPVAAGKRRRGKRLGWRLCGLALAAWLQMEGFSMRSGAADTPPWRTVTLETVEVTQPGVAVSPDGRTLIFTLLGRLFQVPAAGGAAVQLTSGFAYDSDPAISPDGRRLAFVSDRDGSCGNVFILDLASRKLSQLTREREVREPCWNPDGKTISYFRPLQREELPGIPGFFGAPQAEVKTIPSAGGPATVAAPPAPYASLFYLPDGRLSWVKPEPGADMFGPPRPMRVEARDADGRMALLATIKDALNHAVIGPKGDGIYYSTSERVRFRRFGGAEAVDLAVLSDGATRPAVAAGGSIACFGDGGGLWTVRLPDGPPGHVSFQASAALEIRRQAEPRWSQPEGDSWPPRAVACPQLSPSGGMLVFTAAGFLYAQSLDGGPARRVSEGGAFERDPAFSPDGKKMAYVAGLDGRRELRVHDIEAKRERVLYAVGGASWPAMPGWSPDGKSIVFQRSDGPADPFRLIRIRLDDGRPEMLAKTTGSWNTRPHFSADGRFLFFTDRRGKYSAVYRLELREGARPEALTSLPFQVSDGVVSPDGRWLALRRNFEVWVAPLEEIPVRGDRLRRITDGCSRSFSFTADSSAVIYAAGNRVRRQPLAGGECEEIPVRLRLAPAASGPLLLRRARLLDLERGAFGRETSLLIRDGKILWADSDPGHAVPLDVPILDCGGRRVIPGLFDVHVHSTWANQQASEDAFIAFGVTSVRDVGGSLDLLNALRDRGEATNLPVPRCWGGGEILEGAMPLWGDAFLQIADEDQARRAVSRLKEWGADLIKVYLTVPWDLQNVMAEEAQRQGIPLAGHAISFEELVRHALQGYASVEHTTAVLHEDGRKLLAAAGTHWVTTLTCEGGSEIFVREEPPVHMAGDLVACFVPEDKIKAALRGGRLSTSPREFWSTNLKAALARVMAAYRDGVKVRVGTDALMAEVFFGLSLHWELEFFAMAGVPPPLVLRLATAAGAEAVGAAARLGSLSPGMLADMVILDADPLADIRDSIRIWRVVKGGHVFDPCRMRSGTEGRKK